MSKLTSEDLLRNWIRGLLLEVTDEEREEIESGVADYLAQGGDIEEVPPGPTSPEAREELMQRPSTVFDRDGQILTYIAEWAVYHAAKNGGRAESVASWVDRDGRMIGPWAGRPETEKNSGTQPASAEEKAELERIYLELYDLAKEHLDGMRRLGDPGEPAGEPGAQSSTEMIDVPLENVDIHVKYNDKKRLESFQRAKSKGTDPGAASTKIYDDVMSEYLAGAYKDLPSYNALINMIPPSEFFYSVKGESSQLSVFPKRPKGVKNMAPVKKRRTALKDGQPSETRKDNADNPYGLIPTDPVAVETAGVSPWQGNEDLWWNKDVMKGKRKINAFSLEELKALSEYDNLQILYKAFTDERSLMLMDPQGFGGKNRGSFLDALEAEGYGDQLKQDVLTQHFREGSHRPAYYAKFWSADEKTTGLRPHKLDWLSYDEIPELDLDIVYTGNKKVMYRFLSDVRGESEALEALVVKFRTDGKNQAPELYAGKDYEHFAKNYLMPQVDPVGSDIETLATNERVLRSLIRKILLESTWSSSRPKSRKIRRSRSRR